MKRVKVVDHGGGIFSWSISSRGRNVVSDKMPKERATESLAEILMFSKGVYRITYSCKHEKKKVF